MKPGRWMPAFAALGAAALLLAGCAALAENECTADSYQIGKRDGRIGAYAQADAYAARCGARSRFEASRYLDGWRDGWAERPKPVV